MRFFIFFLLYVTLSAPLVAQTPASSATTTSTPNSPAALNTATTQNTPAVAAVNNPQVTPATAPFWPSRKALLETILTLLKNAKDEGLNSDHYKIDEMPSFEGKDPSQIMALDQKITAVILKYMHDLRGGRLVGKNLKNLFIDMPAQSHQKVFDEMISQNSIKPLLDFFPKNVEYLKLKHALSYMRRIHAQNFWPTIDLATPKLAPGMHHPSVIIMRENLQRFGYDLKIGEQQDLYFYDNRLASFVKIFQAQNGLEADGVIGLDTIKAFNKLPAEHIKQILINMERWRRMPDHMEERFLMVNIANFELSAYEAGTVAFTMPVIVGKTYRKTPVFSAPLFSLTVNPDWNVPQSIAVRDKLPLLRKNPSQLTKKGFKVYQLVGGRKVEVNPNTINWNSVSSHNFNYHLWQSPGRGNALGGIRFNIKNPYSVYLHGTPDQKLFSKHVRALSSGCVRLEDPLKLATFLLKDQSNVSLENIKALIGRGGSKQIFLDKMTPVYINYVTSWVTKEGYLQLRPDFYGYDEKIWAFIADTPLI